MPPKAGPRDPYALGSPLMAPVSKKPAAAAPAAAPAPAPAPAKKTRRRRRRRHGKKGVAAAAHSSKKTTAKSPSSSASTKSSSASSSVASSMSSYRRNADMPDKAEILSDLLDLISMNEELGDNEEVARLYKIYYSLIADMTERDKVNLGRVKD